MQEYVATYPLHQYYRGGEEGGREGGRRGGGRKGGREEGRREGGKWGEWERSKRISERERVLERERGVGE